MWALKFIFLSFCGCRVEYTNSSEMWRDWKTFSQPTVGDLCETENKPCPGLRYSICRRGFCHCQDGFYHRAGACKAELGEFVEEENDCGAGIFKNNRCVCTSDNFYNPHLRACVKGEACLWYFCHKTHCFLVNSCRWSWLFVHTTKVIKNMVNMIPALTSTFLQPMHTLRCLPMCRNSWPAFQPALLLPRLREVQQRHPAVRNEASHRGVLSTGCDMQGGQHHLHDKQYLWMQAELCCTKRRGM